MDKVLAQGATRPAAAEKRFIAVERFLTDLAVPGFNSQQHRLPVPAAFLILMIGSIAKAQGERQGAKTPLA